MTTLRWALAGIALGLTATWALIWWALPFLADPSLDITTEHITLRVH